MATNTAGFTSQGFAAMLNLMSNADRAQTTQPFTFYIMLVNAQLSETSTLASAVVNEIGGPDYTRRACTFNPAQTNADLTATAFTNVVQYLAENGAIGPYQSVGLCDVASGSSGNLIGYYNYPGSVTIAQGSGAAITFPLQLTP